MPRRTSDDCRFCGTKLTADNWLPSMCREGRKICAPCNNKRMADYYQKHRAKRLAFQNDYYREIGRERREALRAEVIAAYGSKCACCGEMNPAFLTVDHVNNDGKRHRQEIGTRILQWLKSRGFPKEGFRILCANCNFGRQWRGGICPHERQLRRIK